MGHLRFKILQIVIMLITLTYIGCGRQQIFNYDFEDEDVFNYIFCKCKTNPTISDKYSTLGKKSLKLEIYPSKYPGISFGNFNHNWSKFFFIKADVFNEEKTTLHLSIRIDDKINPEYDDRYNNTLVLKSGANHISIELDRLVTSGTNRRLNLNRIERIIFFVVMPEKKKTLYLDNLRLE